MKKIVLALLATTAASVAFSAPNTITFQGEVSEQTCSVNVNGNEDSPIVLLPTVPSSALGASGNTAGTTTFNIAITGCTASGATTTMGVAFIGNNVTANGNLGNTGSAQNVELQLLDAAGGNTVDLTSPATVSGTHILNAGETAADHDFAVQYYANGSATAGTVISSVQYAISYE